MGNTLEHAEHIAHAGHDHSHHERFGTFVGMTIAALGVLLAFCAAKVGGERTELIQQLVEQANAHAKYQGQDVKHRVAFMALEQVHATAFTGPNPAVNKEGILSMAKTVERYLAESKLAKAWLEAFDKRIDAHMHGQEEYEHAQLAAEIGIVIGSVALLIKSRALWGLSLAIGALAIGITAKTYHHTHKAVHEAQHHIDETGKTYRDTRNQNKTTDFEKQLIEKIRTWAETAK